MMSNDSYEQDAFDLFRFEKQKELLAANRLLKYREAARQCRDIWNQMPSYRKSHYISMARRNHYLRNKSENELIENKNQVSSWLSQKKLETDKDVSKKEENKTKSVNNAWGTSKYNPWTTSYVSNKSNVAKKSN